MFDSTVFRAIMIGAGVIIILGVFSLLMIYYNNAKEMTVNSDVLMPIDTTYSYYIEESIRSAFSDNLGITATQLQSIINYYYESNDVIVNVRGIKLLDGTNTFSVNNVNKSRVGSDFNLETYKKIMLNIDPGYKYSVNISEEYGITTILLSNSQEI